ncbi:MAG: hypothetical protein IJ538_03295 [Clostridia bacterium]|nr:hypothetical protein [Clostridia bacterium]
MKRAKHPSKPLLAAASLIAGIQLTGCNFRDTIFAYPQIQLEEYIEKVNQNIGNIAFSDIQSAGFNIDSLEFQPKPLDYADNYENGKQLLTFYNVLAKSKENEVNIDFTYETSGYGLVLEEIGRSRFNIAKTSIYYLGDLETLRSILKDKNTHLQSVVNHKTKEPFYTFSSEENNQQITM